MRWYQTGRDYKRRHSMRYQACQYIGFATLTQEPGASGFHCSRLAACSAWIAVQLEVEWIPN